MHSSWGCSASLKLLRQACGGLLESYGFFARTIEEDDSGMCVSINLWAVVMAAS